MNPFDLSIAVVFIPAVSFPENVTWYLAGVGRTSVNGKGSQKGGVIERAKMFCLGDLMMAVLVLEGCKSKYPKWPGEVLIRQGTLSDRYWTN